MEALRIIKDEHRNLWRLAITLDQVIGEMEQDQKADPAFIGSVLDECGDCLDYLELWNEPNNLAEWTGDVEAHKLARRLGAERVDLLLVSKLIVEQLHGRWRVKDAKLQPLWSTAPPTRSSAVRCLQPRATS
ncbi:MAG: hypothetical protein HGA75_17070 [Thiobacillus sp.]|nr:hypothetical protein [Thiobacillus sp.]